MLFNVTVPQQKCLGIQFSVYFSKKKTHLRQLHFREHYSNGGIHIFIRVCIYLNSLTMQTDFDFYTV